MKMLLLFLVMAVPKQTCIDDWKKKHLVQGFVDNKPAELYIRDDAPMPEMRYIVQLSSTTLPVSEADKKCYDIYLGKIEVQANKVKP